MESEARSMGPRRDEREIIISRMKFVAKDAQRLPDNRGVHLDRKLATENRIPADPVAESLF